MLTLCPHLISKLGWSRSGENPLEILDGRGEIAVTTICWVDGTDQLSTHDRESFGRGQFVVATPAAWTAIEEKVGPLLIGVKVRHVAVREGKDRIERNVLALG